MGEKPYVESGSSGKVAAIGECGVLIAAPRVLRVTVLVLQGADFVTLHSPISSHVQWL